MYRKRLALFKNDVLCVVSYLLWTLDVLFRDIKEQ
jgi:hypothetical protein